MLNVKYPSGSTFDLVVRLMQHIHPAVLVIHACGKCIYNHPALLVLVRSVNVGYLPDSTFDLAIRLL